MSDYKQGPVLEAPETTAGNDRARFILRLPARDDGSMTIGEFEEAVEDESHPRHAEAVQHSRDLAQLRSTMERLRQTTARMQQTILKLIPSIDVTKPVDPKVDLPKFHVPTLDTLTSDFADPMVESRRWQMDWAQKQKEFDRADTAAAEARPGRQFLEDQRAAQRLEVLTLMEAHMAQLNCRIESVESRIEAGSAASSKREGWMILVAVLTLLATIAGIGLPVLSR